MVSHGLSMTLQDVDPPPLPYTSVCITTSLQIAITTNPIPSSANSMIYTVTSIVPLFREISPPPSFSPSTSFSTTMFTKNLRVFTPQRKRFGSFSNFYLKFSSSMSDIPREIQRFSWNSYDLSPNGNEEMTEAGKENKRGEKREAKERKRTRRKDGGGGDGNRLEIVNKDETSQGCCDNGHIEKCGKEGNKTSLKDRKFDKTTTSTPEERRESQTSIMRSIKDNDKDIGIVGGHGNRMDSQANSPILADVRNHRECSDLNHPKNSQGNGSVPLQEKNERTSSKVRERKNIQAKSDTIPIKERNMETQTMTYRDRTNNEASGSVLQQDGKNRTPEEHERMGRTKSSSTGDRKNSFTVEDSKKLERSNLEDQKNGQDHQYSPEVDEKNEKTRSPFHEVPKSSRTRSTIHESDKEIRVKNASTSTHRPLKRITIAKVEREGCNEADNSNWNNTDSLKSSLMTKEMSEKSHAKLGDRDSKELGSPTVKEEKNTTIPQILKIEKTVPSPGTLEREKTTSSAYRRVQETAEELKDLWIHDDPIWSADHIEFTKNLRKFEAIRKRSRMCPVRDRSRVGCRSSLPFCTPGLASSSSASSACTASSGASDTQSQGSGGGDSKSDSPTPEGSRKNGESSSTSSSSTSSGVRCGKGHELPVSAAGHRGTGERENTALRQEVETLRAEITKARQTILHMQEREKKLKERMNDKTRIERTSLAGLAGSPRLENLALGERRPSALVRRYGNLYAQARVDTLDSLDSLPDLKNAEELKSKILFSVVVLAFRSVSGTASTVRDEVRRILQVAPPPPTPADKHSLPHAHDPHTHALELAVTNFITANIDQHDLTKNVDEVCRQIYATLYDYPSLEQCEGLLQYIKTCVRLAWGLTNQTPPYVIEYETRTFRRDTHVRFHTADPENDQIKTYLWPALLEGPGGPCMHKGVVIT